MLLTLFTALALASSPTIISQEQGWAEVAQTAGLPIERVHEVLGDPTLQQDVLTRMATPWEAKPWSEYGPIFEDEDRLRSGAAFWKEHRATLERVEEQTGVPAQIIVAILGVETRYGRIMGADRVTDALYTLGFHHPRRGAFFRKELGHFARLCHDEGWTSSQVGSYAGAMGMPQFMPSSYRAWAVDGNGDGTRDLFESPDDAIASIANYLAEHGWKRDEDILVPASGQASVLESHHSRGLKLDTTWSALSASGVHSTHPIPEDAPVRLFRFQASDGPEYRLGRTNFYVITRYNHSALYARAVYELGERLNKAVSAP